MCSATCRGRRKGSASRRLRVAAATATSLCSFVGMRSADAAVPSTGSAIGDEVPLWIAVAPDYPHSHMVAALAAPMSKCSDDCSHLWVTRDGGGSWHSTRLPFAASHLVLLTDGSGRDSVVTSSKAGMERSDDDGVTWRTIGAAGFPARLGSADLAVAVPDGQDYIVTGGAQRTVDGSRGAGLDLAFATSRTAGAGRAAALLAAVDRATGTDSVLRCDAAMSCASAAALPGSHTEDVSLDLATDFGDSDVAFARTSTALYRSADGGGSFIPVALPGTEDAAYTVVAGLTLLPASDSDGDTMFVALLSVAQPVASKRATTAGGVYTSRDGGMTWRGVGRGAALDGGATSVAASPDGRVFAGFVGSDGRGGLLCSQDGNDWRPACSPVAPDCATGCAAPAQPGTTPRANTATSPGAVGLAPGSAAGAPPTAAANGKVKLEAIAAEGGDGPSVSVAAVLLIAAAALLVIPLSTFLRRRR
jgi:hypothetical protein